MHLDDLGSDHRPILMDLNPSMMKAKKFFHFDARWVATPDVHSVISEAWNKDCIGSPLFKIFSKLKTYRHALNAWSRQRNHNS